MRLITALLLVFAAVVAPTGTVARDVPFNEGWLFHRDGAAFDPARAETVTLPHTARIEPRLVNDQWQGNAWYLKRFEAPDDRAGQQVWLRFEAAMNVAEVWVNGREIATHLGGYLPFTVDLTPHLKRGVTNEIQVRLDNRDNPVTGPKPLEQLDFSTYGGLYRGVRLTVKPPVHFTDEMLADRVAGGGLFVTYSQVSADQATVEIAAHVANAGPQNANATVRHRLYHGDALVAESAALVPLSAGASLQDRQRIEIDAPRLWSPRSPHLYRLVTTVEDGFNGNDRIETRIGIRQFAFDDQNQLLINGERMFLRGVNRHQEYPYVGYAISPEADYRDAKLIKKAGFDYVRLSHYPHSPAFMAAADELGLVLIDAIPGWQFVNPDPAFRQQVMQTCRDMIRRDRNHPSVLAWECSLNESRMPLDMVAEFDRIVSEEYPGAWSAGWQDDGYDIYLQARQHRLQHYETPDKPYVVSEYGDWEYYAQNAGLQQDSWADLKEEARTSRQPLGSGEARLLQQATNAQEAHEDNLTTPAFADGYWVMFDYNRGYADDLEHSGLMSLERLPKFAYDFFRSQRPATEVSELYEGGPMVAIASYWTARSHPQIRVFSNAEEVELLLDGKSLGRKRAERGRISQNVANPPFLFDLGGFAPGTLEAVGYIGGAAVARDRVTTPRRARAFCLALDDAGVPVGPRDLVFLRARLLDEAGNIVPTEEARFRFTAPEGWEIVGPDSAESEAGIASVLVRNLGGTSGAPAFSAVAEGASLSATQACAAER